jgi:hypothetical protein
VSLGQVANATNGLISIGRGRYFSGALSLGAALLPVGGGLVSDAGRAAEVAKLAQETALVAREAGAARGAAAALKVGDDIFTDLSAGAREALGGTWTELHPEVQDVLDTIPHPRVPYHGYCAELQCISQALTAGKTGQELAGSEIATSSVVTGAAKTPCSSCTVVLQYFKLKF